MGLDYFNYGWSNRSDQPYPERTDIRGRLRVTNNIFFPYLGLRFDSPRNRRFAPYIEILGGVNYMYTQSYIRSSVGTYKAISFDDIQLGYGLGAGLRFRVIEDIGGQGFMMSVVMNAKYLRSPEISYLREGDLIVIDDTVVFNEQNSVFELIALEAGIVFQL